LGTYLGALRNWVQLQHEYEELFLRCKSHAITVKQDPEQLFRKTRELRESISRWDRSGGLNDLCSISG